MWAGLKIKGLLAPQMQQKLFLGEKDDKKDYFITLESMRSESTEQNFSKSAQNLDRHRVMSVSLFLLTKSS